MALIDSKKRRELQKLLKKLRKQGAAINTSLCSGVPVYDNVKEELLNMYPLFKEYIEFVDSNFGGE